MYAAIYRKLSKLVCANLPKSARDKVTQCTFDSIYRLDSLKHSGQQ